MRKFLLPLDFAAVGLVILLALASILLTSVAVIGAEPSAALVSFTGGELTILLDADGEYPIESNGYHMIITVAEGVVSVDTDCPDRLCCGELSRPGQTLVCLPARAVITIGGESEHDAIIG